MKTLAFTIACSFLTSGLFAQRLCVELKNHYTQLRMYRGGHNALSFMVNDIPCNEIFVQSDNGTIEQDSCRLTVFPKDNGSVRLSFYHTISDDTVLIDQKSYGVVDIPVPMANIYKKNKVIFSKNAIMHCRGLEAINNDTHLTGCGIPTPITQFKVLILRGDSVAAFVSVVGAKFNEEVLMAFQELQSEDVVHFIDVKALSIYKEEVELESIKFTVH